MGEGNGVTGAAHGASGKNSAFLRSQAPGVYCKFGIQIKVIMLTDQSFMKEQAAGHEN